MARAASTYRAQRRAAAKALHRTRGGGVGQNMAESAFSPVPYRFRHPLRQTKPYPGGSVPGSLRRVVQRRTARHGTYIGPDMALHGETALLMALKGYVLAQFDNTDIGLGFGWTAFRHADFNVDSDPFAEDV